MSSVSKNDAKKRAVQCDGAKHAMNINEKMARELNAFYRESDPILLTDSGGSSGGNSVSNDSDYQTSAGNLQGNYYGLNNSRDEIAEQLSKIKIGYNNKNLKSDSGNVHDLTSDNDLQSDSIICGNTGAHINPINSIHSVADSRFSIILAGRLDSKEDLYAPRTDETSLLNIAIHESIQTNDLNESNNPELSHFVDSLEAPRKEEVSYSEISSRDSLEACAVNKLGNNLIHNDENRNPNSLKLRKRGQPEVISNETFRYPVKIIGKSSKKPFALANKKEGQFLEPVSKYGREMVDKSSNPLERTAENKFHSLLSESEQKITADVETPNIKGICFIEDCCKSTPRIEVHADTFGSELMSDISNLSCLGCGKLEETGNINLESADSCRNEIFKRFSQNFVQEPTKFTERLITIVEQSFMGNTKTEDPDISGVNLSRLTQEFKKILKSYGKRIEDESMPEFGFGPSFNVSTISDANLVAGNSAADNTASSPFHNFSKLGGGRKIYRKTPRRVFQNNKGTHCGTPNCANPMHKAKNNNSYSSDCHRDADEIHDDTATFEFWEKLCYEMTPKKKSRHEVTLADIPGVVTREDLIRKSDEQMAALDISSPAELNNEKEERFEYTEKNSQDQSSSMREKLIHHLSPSLRKGDDKSNAIREFKYKEIVRAVEKRRKCFEEARKVFECKQESPLKTKNCRTLDKASPVIEKNESPMQLDYQYRFVNTISACVDYFEHVQALKDHGNTLQCILECSEDSECPKDKSVDSGSIETVKAVIYPAKYRVEYRIEDQESRPKNNNQIAQTYLYIPGTPQASSNKSPSRSPKRRSILSPRTRSPRTQSGNVLTKKIKSPVPPARRLNSRAVKPASHTCSPRTPSVTPEIHRSENKKSSVSCRSGINSIPRCASHNKLKSSTNKPSPIDVTNTKMRNTVPKLTLTNATPSCDSQKKSSHMNVMKSNIGRDCQRELKFSDSDTPEIKPKRFFHTPGKTPACTKIKPKIKYFQTPKKKLPGSSPGSHRINYNTVQSPVGEYIKGTNPNLITNVRGKTNERMLTPRSNTPNSRSKISSPILARSPCMSPQPTESSRLKFQLTPAKKQILNQEDNLLDIALCESNLSPSIGSESTSHSLFPQIFYKPAPSLKMVKDDKLEKRYPKCLAKGREEKIIYRHEGRLKSATESRVPNYPTDDSTKDSVSCDLGDISLLHQRPVAKSNYLPKK